MPNPPPDTRQAETSFPPDAGDALKPIVAAPGEYFKPVGAHVTDAGVVYRVWAPDHETVAVAIGGGNEPGRRVRLRSEPDGFFSGLDPAGRAGDLYQYEVGNARLADPASRYQPLGVEGPSQVVDSRAYPWVTRAWRPPSLRGRIIYELHVGTFTPEGTFVAAIERLDALVELGVNAIEVMPVADFAGGRNWGYDGVALFAPARCYGKPDDFRALVDAAHARGIAVVLDVVYNHLGPVGNVLGRFAKDYFHPARESGWGQSLNFDGPNSEPVRAFFLQNACHWLDEYRIDGLRLDALHAIEDSSPTPLPAEIAAAVHARGGFVIGEDERNDALIVMPGAEDGWALDGVWADDFHHTVRVALTGQQEAHFSGYRGSTAELARILRDGWFYCGQTFPVWGRPRGTSCAHVPPERFVYCISNHDQVGNRPLGDRLHEVVSREAYRAVSMLLCLSPYTPMLFQGQEWAASSPFPYFTDHSGEIGERIRDGRLQEYRDRKADYTEDVLARMPDPQAESTFRAAKLNWAERDEGEHGRVLALYRECLKVRREHPVFQSAPRERWRVQALGDVLALRWRDQDRDWLLLFSLTQPDERIVDAEFARPGAARHWKLVLASNEERFGGTGTREATGGENGVPVLASPGAMLLVEG